MNWKLIVKTINNFYHAPFFRLFLEVHLIEGRPWTTLLNHEQLFDVNQNLLARALKIHFHHLLFFPLSLFIDNQRTSYFHKNSCYKICLSSFYHMCFIPRGLISWFFKVSKFDWFSWISHRAPQNIVNGLCWSIIIKFEFN